MKALTLTIAILFFPSLAIAETLEGDWTIKVVPAGKDQFPWWQKVKYPTKLVVTKTGAQFNFEFTDQYEFTCSGMAMSARTMEEKLCLSFAVG
tara:strand:- start:2610 stop:2888 length:279 start_codon:yes stop_codon:yes gene_type:complete